MRKWRAILFDLDDTLYPERAYMSCGFRAVAKWAEPRSGVSVEQGRAELDALFDGGAKHDTFDQWFARYGMIGDEVIAQALAIYRGHEPTLVPFPEIARLLGRLKDDYQLGIVSDGDLGVQQKKMAALGLADFFAVIVFSDEMGRESWKPSPLPFQLALERLGVEASETVYVGDNPRKDFLGARRAGLASIWLKTLGGLYTELTPSKDEDADMSVNSFAELENIFKDDLNDYENIHV